MDANEPNGATEKVKVSKKAWSISQRYETILIGDPYSGKSTYLNSLVSYEKSRNLPVMISPDQNQFEFWAENKAKKAIFIVRDTANQERFRSLTQSYYRKAQCVLLAFDLNNEESFLNLKKWHDDAMNYCESQDKSGFAIVLVGIKKKRDPDSAYVSSAVVENQLIEEFIEQHSNIIDYCMVDLANEINLKEPFNMLLDHFSRKPSDDGLRGTLDPRQSGAKTELRKPSKKDNRRLSLDNPNFGFKKPQLKPGKKPPGRIDEEEVSEPTSGRRSVKREFDPIIGQADGSPSPEHSDDESQPKKCCCVS